MTGIVAHTYPEWWLKLTGQVAHWSTDYSISSEKYRKSSPKDRLSLDSRLSSDSIMCSFGGHDTILKNYIKLYDSDGTFLNAYGVA